MEFCSRRSLGDPTTSGETLFFSKNQIRSDPSLLYDLEQTEDAVDSWKIMTILFAAATIANAQQYSDYGAADCDSPVCVDGGFYVSGYGGINGLSNHSQALPLIGDVDVAFSSAAAMGGSLGYRLPQFANGNQLRLEFDFTYRHENEIDSMTVAGVTAAAPAGSYVSSTSYMANLVYDFSALHDRFVPYAGLGVGGISTTMFDQPTQTEFDSTDFGYQALAGLTWKCSSNLELFGEYRFTDSTGEVDLGAGFELGNQSHSGLFGLRWNFR